MKAVVQYEMKDEDWYPVAVYLFGPKIVQGRARPGRPDVTAWVESVVQSAEAENNVEIELLADHMVERFSKQEYGTLYELTEPAPSVDVLAVREFVGLEAAPFATEQVRLTDELPDTLSGWKTRKR